MSKDNSRFILRSDAAAKEIGGKGARLSELAKAGVIIPKTIALEASFLEASGEGSFSPSVKAEILKLFDRHISSSPVAVRSSCNVEDGAHHSFAGVFDSLLDIKREGLLEAVSKVWSSRVGERALAYTARNKIPLAELKMSVLVQEQIDCQFAGVCFTRHPVTGVCSYFVEFVRGRGDKLVSGEAEPKRVAVPFDAEQIEGDLSSYWLNLRGELSKVRNLYTKPQDIEWAIDARGKVFILQSRDITTLVSGVNKEVPIFSPAHELASSLICLSSGEVTGILCCASSDTNGPARKILYRERLLIEELAVLEKFDGLITGDVSLLSHAAIQARELKIPAVGGFSSALASKLLGHEVSLWADSGVVTVAGAVPVGRKTRLELGCVNHFRTDLTPKRFLDIECFSRSYKGQEILYPLRMSDTAALREAAKGETVVAEGAWEGEGAPTIVAEQARVFKRIENDAALSRYLDEAIRVTKIGGLEELVLFATKIDALAADAFKRAVTEWQKSNRRDIESVGSHLDIAKTLAIDLIGTVLVECLVPETLELRFPNIELATVLRSNEGPKDLLEYLRAVTKIKNSREAAVTHNGIGAFELISKLYEEGHGPELEKYRW